MTLDTSWNQNVDFSNNYLNNFKNKNTPTVHDIILYSHKNNTSYIIKLTDFSFNDADVGDTLELVEILSLPSKGTLKLNNINISVNAQISKLDISNNNFSYNFQTSTSFDISFSFKLFVGAFW